MALQELEGMLDSMIIFPRPPKELVNKRSMSYLPIPPVTSAPAAAAPVAAAPAAAASAAADPVAKAPAAAATAVAAPAAASPATAPQSSTIPMLAAHCPSNWDQATKYY